VFRNKVKRVILFIATILALLGCITPASLITGAITGGPPSGGPLLDASVNGDAKNQAVKIEHRQTDKRKITLSGANSIMKEETVTINKGPSVWYTLLFALGWLLPSFSETFKIIGRTYAARFTKR
jgi:hypothetical protein